MGASSGHCSKIATGIATERLIAKTGWYGRAEKALARSIKWDRADASQLGGMVELEFQDQF